MLVLVLNSYWAFGEFMLRQASNINDAYFWSKMLFLWPFFVSLLLHFVLVFSQNSLLKKKSTYIVLYLPALGFSIIDLATNWVSDVPIKEYWGYAISFPLNSWIGRAYGVWSAVFALLALILCVAYYFRVSEGIQKQHVKYVTLGLGFLVIISIITNSLFPLIGVKIPGLTTIASGVLAGFIGYAVWKFKLFSLNSAVAAENIISTMPDSLIIADMKGKIVTVNRCMVDFLGYCEHELFQKSVPDLFADTNSGQETFAELLEKSTLKNTETVFRTKLGDKKFVAFSGSVIKDVTGQDVGITCIIHDITHRKQMEEKLIKAERFASIGELSGMIGHDLRNPMTSIVGAIYYLKLNYSDKLDNTGVEMLDVIEHSIEYSNKIVSDLLDYSRDLKLDLEPVSPKFLLSNVFVILDVPSGIEIKDLTMNSPKLNVDIVKMGRVFVNVVKNAFDAMPNGGVLTVSSKEVDGNLVIKFNDTGQGMSQETLEKLWTPLFTTKAKGMGFGLSICKRIIEAHGGQVIAHSVLFKGTTITITLPLQCRS
jgi:PAS domain S-box-containing protein